MANKKTDNTKITAVAGVAAAAAAAAAGAYWLYGAKDAAKHRKLAKSWMLKARAEVLEGVEKLQDIDKEKYLAIVDDVMSRYGKTGGAEAKKLMQDLRSGWMYMQAQKGPAVRRAKAVKKSVKKTAKKARR
ncbi:MAG TPA: hypothetical protein VGP13_03015 [Candidatus Paceibacterota bacterium]|jgi:hypothetical protein|nr:hypothetical protein [Candidatus Paceibacterota bacterium]